MASNLCAHFWPEFSRVQVEIVVDTWITHCDAAAATEEYLNRAFQRRMNRLFVFQKTLGKDPKTVR